MTLLEKVNHPSAHVGLVSSLIYTHFHLLLGDQLIRDKSSVLCKKHFSPFRPNALAALKDTRPSF